MKHLIAIFLLVSSMSAFADCETEIDSLRWDMFVDSQVQSFNRTAEDANRSSVESEQQLQRWVDSL